jgi:hypothetical protein
LRRGRKGGNGESGNNEAEKKAVHEGGKTGRAGDGDGLCGGAW